MIDDDDTGDKEEEEEEMVRRCIRKQRCMVRCKCQQFNKHDKAMEEMPPNISV